MEPTHNSPKHPVVQPEDSSVKNEQVVKNLKRQTIVARIAGVAFAILAATTLGLGLASAVFGQPVAIVPFAAATLFALLSHDCFQIASNIHSFIKSNPQATENFHWTSAKSSPEEKDFNQQTFYRNSILLGPFVK